MRRKRSAPGRVNKRVRKKSAEGKSFFALLFAPSGHRTPRRRDLAGFSEGEAVLDLPAWRRPEKRSLMERFHRQEDLDAPARKRRREGKIVRSARRQTKRRREAAWGLHISRKALIILLSLLFAVLLCTAGFLYVSKAYAVTQITVDGNTHYTDQEIADMVMDDGLSHNSLYLCLKYRGSSIRDVPFVEKMDVEILSPHAVRIHVYEKALAGYISYLGRYMYFDREGIIVESSGKADPGLPEVMGLDFHSVVLDQPLPVEKAEVFAEILDISQLLSKYKLRADRIYFDDHYNVYLYFGKVEVNIGSSDFMDDKIIQLQHILPKLEGKKGILKLQDYDETTRNITFEQLNG